MADGRKRKAGGQRWASRKEEDEGTNYESLPRRPSLCGRKELQLRLLSLSPNRHGGEFNSPGEKR